MVADRVWFLNDKYLVFDGPISELREKAEPPMPSASQNSLRSLAPPGSFGLPNPLGPSGPLGPLGSLGSVQSAHTAAAPGNRGLVMTRKSGDMEFSTWAGSVRREFEQVFGAQQVRVWQVKKGADSAGMAAQLAAAPAVQGSDPVAATGATAAESPDVEDRYHVWRVPAASVQVKLNDHKKIQLPGFELKSLIMIVIMILFHLIMSLEWLQYNFLDWSCRYITHSHVGSIEDLV